MTTNQSPEGLAKAATCEILGYNDWDDATDYRNGGEADRRRDRVLQIVLTALRDHAGAGDALLREHRDRAGYLIENLDRVIKGKPVGDLLESRLLYQTHLTRIDNHLSRTPDPLSELQRLGQEYDREAQWEWPLGARVTKTKGSSWTGMIVGFYSTALTREGYAVESENEPGSVQIYPRAALALSTRDGERDFSWLHRHDPPHREPFDRKAVLEEAARAFDALTVIAAAADEKQVCKVAQAAADGLARVLSNDGEQDFCAENAKKSGEGK